MIGFANMCQNVHYTKIEFPYVLTQIQNSFAKQFFIKATRRIYGPKNLKFRHVICLQLDRQPN